MNENQLSEIAREIGIRPGQVKAVQKLLEEGCTIPFIARYRKEATGELDEVQILAIRDACQKLEELEKRRQSILSSLEERELLTSELKATVKKAKGLTELEDIYLPYRPKRRTRGTAAREAGLEPLAQWLLNQATGASIDKLLRLAHPSGTGKKAMEAKASDYLNPEFKIDNVEKALAGARDIIAEVISEEPRVRQDLRRTFQQKGQMSSQAARGKKEDPEAAKYKDYFKWSEDVRRAPSHRILAVLRGTSEGFLSCHFLPREEDALPQLSKLVMGPNRPEQNSAAKELQLAMEDSYKRLIAPSLETELKNALKERADQEAIEVFAGNIRELLMASPLGEKRILALDPGLRTGCKLVCLNEQGALLHHDVIYPLAPKNQVGPAALLVQKLCREFRIEALAVGNGTGGREAEAFARQALQASPQIAVIMVNESGASVYSASKTAREEFPDQDVTVRGAVSIGRRLMDPLAELVKIDPKSIGVGQYQHDVDQKALQQSLEDVVRSCVNSVGVEVNTASKELLSQVSGISARMAGNICKHREQKGAFKTRQELLKVSGLGPKAYEQAAGFLRIRGGSNPLDQSAVHPESYGLVEQMAKDLQATPHQLIQDQDLRRQIKLDRYVTNTVGMPTLRDILSELEKPGRDPRQAFEVFQFSDAVHEIEDLEEGMELPGVVTNVTAFGAFVDLGVHQDGLVHISQLADRFVQDPADVVKVNQKVKVQVMEVDLKRKRISLTMKGINQK